MLRRYILTGSSEVLTMSAMSDSLAGRIEMHNLWPLSQEEIIGRKSDFLLLIIIMDEKNIIDYLFTTFRYNWNFIGC